MMKTKLFLLATAFSVPVLTEAQVSIQDVGGWFESGYVTFTPIDEAASYSVYYKTAESEYQKIDDQLVRNYDSYGRADAMGLTAGPTSLQKLNHSPSRHTTVRVMPFSTGKHRGHILPTGS